MTLPKGLKESIKIKSKQLGFILAGVTTPDPPPHSTTFKTWLEEGRHGAMEYLADERSCLRRADPKQILPECQSILVLAIPYSPLKNAERRIQNAEFQIASYALGEDYHEVIPPRLQKIVEFIEEQVGHPVPNRYYTDTGPILERDLAQRAGLGWIGKNSMLIHPKFGSAFFLAEILLGIDPSTGPGPDLEPDDALITDHCGTCTRCLDACPTHCILPDRTLDARRCISYLTIELKDDIPEDLRPLMQDWIFGCDICQMACPWNRFAPGPDPAFQPRIPLQTLTGSLALAPRAFNERFRKSPIKRAKRRGFLRNVSVALGNTADETSLPALEGALKDDEPMIREHANWAIQQIKKRANPHE